MKKLYYILVCGIIVGCSGTKQFTDQDNQAFVYLKTLVAAKKIIIESYRANPMASAAFSQVANSGLLGVGNTASSIDITSNSNYLKIMGDSVSAFLPFYGEQNFGGGYSNGNHTGIEFKGVPTDYVSSIDEVKHSISIQFTIDDQYRNIEHYRVYITLFPNKRSNVQILSTSRSSMEYAGRADGLKETIAKR